MMDMSMLYWFKGWLIRSRIEYDLPTAAANQELEETSETFSS